MKLLFLISILFGLLLYIGVPQKIYIEIANYRGQTTNELTIDIRNSAADIIMSSSNFIAEILRVDNPDVNLASN